MSSWRHTATPRHPKLLAALSAKRLFAPIQVRTYILRITAFASFTHILPVYNLSCGPMVFSLNISGTLNVFRLLRDPSLCLPHHTVSTFKDLPRSFPEALQRNGEKVDIRAVVLDKDNCFAVPKTNEIHKSCKVKYYLDTFIPRQCPTLPLTIYRAMCARSPCLSVTHVLNRNALMSCVGITQGRNS